MITSLKKETYDKMMRLQILNLRGNSNQTPRTQGLQSVKREVDELREAINKDVMTKTAWNGHKNILVGTIAQVKKELSDQINQI